MALTAQQRAALFAQSTRQHHQMLPMQTVSALGENITINLPKARLLTRVFLDVEADINITHASASTIAQDAFTPYKLLRRITMDLNNGFSPFVIGGKELALYDMLNTKPHLLIADEKTDKNGLLHGDKFVASSAGTSNKVRFTLQLPVCLNQRDPYGMILLQNESTQVTVSCDIISNFAEMFASVSGYTIALTSCKITPMVETFSVPAIKEAFPDLSTIKLVNSKAETYIAGQNVVKMNVGTIYRKIMLYLTDANGDPVDHEDIAGNFELIFNQADIPYAISPRMLAAKNTDDYGYPLPKGVYVFDFSTQGVPNLGSSRDLIDTQKLTEFWIRFTTAAGGTVNVVSEALATLKA